jgi:multisubunit Na+/H+ antiporter MnhE subunit
MKILVAFTVGLVIWIVLWALGTKALDSFLITLALVLGAVVVTLTEPFIREQFRP